MSNNSKNTVHQWYEFVPLYRYLWVKSSNVHYIVVYSATSAESLRIARARNNPDSFLTATKPLVSQMSRWGELINSIILKSFKKYQGDLNVYCLIMYRLKRIQTKNKKYKQKSDCVNW